MLKEEVTTLNEKPKEDARLHENVQEEKTNLKAELTAICGQEETARVDAITEFKASQPFIDAYAIYYGDKFKDCLNQVRSVYPKLDLSNITMDSPLPTTPAHGDIISEETNDSTESKQDSKDDGVVLAQPTIDGSIIPLALSTNDPPNQDARTPLHMTPKTQLPRTPQTFNLVIFMYQFLFSNSSKCPSFLGFFCKHLLFMAFIISVSFSIFYYVLIFSLTYVYVCPFLHTC